MRLFKNPNFLICLSALLLALGTYLITLEVPIRVAYEPAAEQYELMRACIPFGFTLWILSVLLICSALRAQKTLATAGLKEPFLMADVIVGIIMGITALSSIFLPWITTERIEPFIETRAGIFDVGRYHTLRGFDLMMGTNSMVGDIILLISAGAITSILHIPLLTIVGWGRKNAVAKAILYLLGGICIATSIASVYAHRTWWITSQVDGALGFSVTFMSPGLGFIIATLCATTLTALGVITLIRLPLSDS